MQVFDLCNGGPLCGLYVFRKIEKYKILVCGGDGTIGWVLQCLDNVGQVREGFINYGLKHLRDKVTLTIVSSSL